MFFFYENNSLKKRERSLPLNQDSFYFEFSRFLAISIVGKPTFVVDEDLRILARKKSGRGGVGNERKERGE